MSLELRPATGSDAARLLEWRNDEETRRNSRSRDPVAEDEHRAWLAAVLADPDRHLLIVELGGAPQGQVRFDRVEEGRYEISVSLAEGARGRGLGTEAIEHGLAWLGERVEAAVVVVAEVREENTASERAFAAAGFERTGGPSDGFVTLEARVR